MKNLVVMLQLLRQYSLFAIAIFFSVFAMGHGAIHEKIEETTEKINKHPLDPNLYVERAGYYKADDDFDKSYADYQHALYIDNSLKTIDFLIAELMYHFDYYYSALEAVTSFEKQKINTAQCYLLKAKIFDKLFEADSALFYAEAAYPHHTKPNTQYFVQVKEYVLFADKTDYENAKKWLVEGKKRLPYDLVIQEEYVNLALKFDDFSTAESLCLEQIPKLKRKEYWQFLLAGVYAKKGDKAQSQEYYNRSLASINKLKNHHRNTTYIINLKKKIQLQLTAQQ
ncbi:MAG: hypothetical protein KJP21_00520 [Bacteroidia bacterium]|nr:hypothetical protein [Bacteroidia bacterium]NNJ56094.1 hypothetical protein [Bacteroidia bacterium]